MPGALFDYAGASNPCIYIYVLHVCYYSFLYNIERFEFKHTYLYGVCYMLFYIDTYLYIHTYLAIIYTNYIILLIVDTISFGKPFGA